MQINNNQIRGQLLVGDSHSRQARDVGVSAQVGGLFSKRNLTASNATNSVSGGGTIYQAATNQGGSRNNTSLLDSLRVALGHVGEFSKEVTGRSQLDTQSGTGAVEGAKQFSDEVRTVVEILFKGAKGTTNIAEGAQESKERISTTLSQGLKGTPDEVFERIGLNGREYLLNQFVDALAERLGQEGVGSADQIVAGSSNGAAATPSSGVAVGAGNVDGSSTGSIAAGVSGKSPSLDSKSGAIIGAIGAGYSIFELVKGWGEMDPLAGAIQGASAGAYLGSRFSSGWGTVIGGVLGGLAGAVNQLFGGGKHVDQVARDGVRAELQRVGFLDQSWGVKLADGSRFSIGIDGGAKLKNLDGSERRAYEIDPSNPLTATVVGMLNPAVTFLRGAIDKLQNDFTGYFTNAALSNAADLSTARANVREIYNDLGLDLNAALKELEVVKGSLPTEVYQAYRGGIAEVFVDHGATSSKVKDVEFNNG